jgi:glycosyltransferase involved in cell wall biosynthesis
LIGALREAGHEVEAVADSAAPWARARVTLYRRLVRRVLPRAWALSLRDLLRPLHARGQARRVVAAAHRCVAEVLVESQVHLAPSGPIAARRAGLSLLLDDCSPPGEELLLGRGLQALTDRVWRRQAAAASILTVSSRALQRRLSQEGAAAERVRVLPNGVDLAAYPAADRAQARARFEAPAGACWIAFVGSFQPWHRVELLVAAVAGLPRSERVVLWLVGDGPGREDALAAARALGIAEAVRAPGALPPERVCDLLAACDIGVLPATNEYGQPMKLLEYGAARLAILAPDVETVLEVLPSREEVVLFPPGEVTCLLRELERLVRDEALRRSLGAAARRRVETAGSWKRRGQELAALLREAMEGAKPADGR